MKTVLFKRTLASLAAVTTILLPLFLVGPLVLFKSNQSEFTVGFLNMEQHLLLPMLLLISAYMLLSFFLPKSLFERVIVFTYGIGCCLYLQANFFSWNYGVFDGTDINWKEYSLRGAIDLSLWGILLFTSLLFYAPAYKRRKIIFAFLLVVQLSYLVVQATSFQGKWYTTRQLLESESVYRFSPKKNVIVIILDGFLSPTFELIIDKFPEHKKQFENFTYFRNTLAPFTTTSPSIPAMLSGLRYDNSEPLPLFCANNLPQRSLPSILHQNGYQVDLVTLPQLCFSVQTTSCNSPSNIDTVDAVVTEHMELAQLVDVSLFRHAPQFIKHRIYAEQDWFLQQMFQKQKGVKNHVNTIQLVQALKRYGAVSSSKPTFKFYHLLLPHDPLRLNADCERVREKPSGKRVRRIDRFRKQARCALNLADQLLEFFKKIGIYHNSLIVITADHGSFVDYRRFQGLQGLPKIQYALPLLLIKPFHSRHPLQTSEVPASLTDLPQTVLEALALNSDIPGRSVFTLTADEERERYYRRYSWRHDYWQKAFLPPMQEYVIRGHAWEGTSWKKGKSFPPAG